MCVCACVHRCMYIRVNVCVGLSIHTCNCVNAGSMLIGVLLW